jgi:hypothetical protein
MAKRKEIAASIRSEAVKAVNASQPMPEMRLLMESLVYEKDPATAQKVEQMAAQYVAGLKALPADKLAARKDEARSLRDAFNYLAKFKIFPADFAPKVQLQQIITDQGWDKKKP